MHFWDMLKAYFSFLAVLLCLVASFSLNAQVVTIDPTFPTENDAVTITFDASQGNKGLEGFTSDVYAHTGVVTDKTVATNGWTNVQGEWGTSNAPKLTSLGNNLYELKIDGIRSFYSVASADEVLKIAILFRNEAGDKAGRAADGGDIFIDIYKSGLVAQITSPQNNQVFGNNNSITLEGSSSDDATLTLFLDGQQHATAQGKEISSSMNVTSSSNHELVLQATNASETVYDTVNFVVSLEKIDARLPDGNQLGINYTSDTSVILALYAPFKDNVFVIGDFNEWKVSLDYAMNRNPNSDTLWTEIIGLEAGKTYAFQYLIDGTLRTSDPFSELVLDPGNDGFISSRVYPDPHPYPSAKTSGIATLIEMGKADFNWEVDKFDAPEEKDLIVYELLVRDFLQDHSYLSLIDSLDYLQNLGINAIELMPVNEFEGNISWGYNPSYHMALDKYYGTPEHFKTFVDECHKRGIAIILDVVYNHAFSQSPLCQMYWDAGNFRPAANSPYANMTAKHDFNVGFDLNHNSSAVKNFVKQVAQYWLTEYKVDGFRFDLSKGFTQKNTLGDIAAWSAYDGERVNTLKRIYSEVKEVNPNAYIILEHFADNREEKELADYGCMFWGNVNHEGLEAAMGYSSNLSGAHHTARNWNEPKLLAYTESHDEERMMYKTLTFGNSEGDYSVRDINTALDRSELAWVVFSSIPGPKLMWQFQELGYEIPIDQNGRTGEKPILWNYFQDSPRKDVYEAFSEMNKLKSTYNAFQGDSFTMDVAGYVKQVVLRDKNQSFIVVGNFDVKAVEAIVPFKRDGMWYEYFSGDSLYAPIDEMIVNLEPGEYQVWTDRPLRTELSIGSINEIENGLGLYPNPARKEFQIKLDQGVVDGYTIYDMSGREVLQGRTSVVDVKVLQNGVYYIEVSAQSKTLNAKFIKVD